MIRKMCMRELTISMTAGSMFPSADDWFKMDAVLEKNELIIWILSVFWSTGSVVMATISVKLLKAVPTFSAVILAYKFKMDAVLEKNELIIWILSVFWSTGSVVMATISVKLLKAVPTFSAVILAYKMSNRICLDSFYWIIIMPLY